jgi:hypothetical protein
MNDFIQEVVDYYQRCNYHTNGPITFSRQMAALALPNLSHAELASVLRQLEANGMIMILNEDQLSFTPKALN